MKFDLIGEPQIVMNNPDGMNKYFAWPTAVRLKNGNIAVGASGYRIDHVCPFGKGVMCVSDDEAKTFTQPMVIIDTYLDDRDVGLCTFGESGLIVTSFNNSLEFQHNFAGKFFETAERRKIRAYRDSYLDNVPPEREAEQMGATFRVSFDNGKTFGKIYKSEITSPHGPVELNDGTVLWVGTEFNSRDSEAKDEGLLSLKAYEIDPETGEMKYRGGIRRIRLDDEDVLNCEPHTMQLPDGTLLCHIRVEGCDRKYFTIFQSESTDGGYTWSEPHQILPDYGGSPSHILRHSSGVLIATYGFRKMEPTHSVKVSFSYDNGKTWQDEQIIYKNPYTGDLGYPSSVELDDGSVITVFYARPKAAEPAIIYLQKWSFEK